jgi:predicted 2-oxoglutarate/Fe(II)-dependent dioxygenase YbiX
LNEVGYNGGKLILYGLIPTPDWEHYGFPVTAETGLLIAFRSDIFHEVTPVTAGERFTIVSWFFSETVQSNAQLVHERP